MTFTWEFEALLYGLLTLATITSVTAIGARLAKRCLPRPPPFDRKELHLDPRDPYADLITSWQILDPLFVRRSAAASATSAPLAITSRARILCIFVVVALLTITTEVVLILSTGTLTRDLRVPDVLPSTFVARFLGEGRNLRNITDPLDDDGCIVRNMFVSSKRRFVKYREALCVRRSEKNHTLGNDGLSEFQLRTEKSTADNMQLWIGNVRFKPTATSGKRFDKKTFGTVNVRVERRVLYADRYEARYIDQDTALRIARVLERVSGCTMEDARDKPRLDHVYLGRPANIANYTCPAPLTVGEILNHLVEPALSAYALYYYNDSSIRYYVPRDAFYVREQQRRRVGVQHSEPYEISWLVLMSALTLLGIGWWAFELWMNRAVNPKIGLLSLMSEEVNAEDCWTNELYRKPKVLYDTDVNDITIGRPQVTRQTFAPNLSRSSPTANALPYTPTSPPRIRRAPSPRRRNASYAPYDDVVGTGLASGDYTPDAGEEAM